MFNQTDLHSQKLNLTAQLPGHNESWVGGPANILLSTSVRHTSPGHARWETFSNKYTPHTRTQHSSHTHSTHHTSHITHLRWVFYMYAGPGSHNIAAPYTEHRDPADTFSRPMSNLTQSIAWYMYIVMSPGNVLILQLSQFRRTAVEPLCPRAIYTPIISFLRRAGEWPLNDCSGS